MSLNSTFSIGVTGLTANEQSLAVIGDNIANAQTAGFKEQRVRFMDLVSSHAGVGDSLGLGVRVAGVISTMTQGAIERTGNSTDMSINGSGFFVLADGEQNVYTRAGQFTLSSSGHLVNPSGLAVQGYSADSNGVISPTLGDVNLGNITAPARGTANMAVAINLDSTSQVVAPFDPTNPVATSNGSNGVVLYDSLGNSHQATIYYRKTASNAWEWHAIADGSEVAGGIPGTNYDIINGTMTFTPNGELDTVTTVANSVDFAGGAAPAQVIDVSFGDPIAAGGTGLAGSTQFAAPITVNGMTQDGATAGVLADFTVASDGTITGVFSNGVVRTVGQIAMAAFVNEEGLSRIGDSSFATTRDSGEALIGIPDAGARGVISTGTVERSNVEMSRALVEMIGVQRAYQANARTISATAEMMQSLVQLGR